MELHEDNASTLVDVTNSDGKLQVKAEAIRPQHHHR